MIGVTKSEPHKYTRTPEEIVKSWEKIATGEIEMTTSKFICEKENCPCCTQAKKNTEKEHIKTGAIISALRISVNQLNHQINKLKGASHESDTN